MNKKKISLQKIKKVLKIIVKNLKNFPIFKSQRKQIILKIMMKKKKKRNYKKKKDFNKVKKQKFPEKI